MEKYPYFVYGLIEELKDCTNPQAAAKIKERIAANVGDPDALIALIGKWGIDFRSFYDSVSSRKPSTSDTIESFLQKFGPSTPMSYNSALSLQDSVPEEDPVTTETVMPDNIAQTKIPDDQTEENPLDTVKKLIKKREYARALEIMEDIYLNNPKKSIYFADQIRYIKKMMLIDKH